MPLVSMSISLPISVGYEQYINGKNQQKYKNDIYLTEVTRIFSNN